MSYNLPFVILSRAIKMIAEILQTLFRHQMSVSGGVSRHLMKLKVNKIEFRGVPRNGGYNLKEVING